MSDLVERARFNAAMMRLSEPVTFGSYGALLQECAAEIETLTALVKRLQSLLADYEREAEQPVICEGATE